MAKRVLVVAPHTDDDTFGAGGVLLKLAERSAEIKIVYATDADARDGVKAIVQAEAIAISDELGSTPVFLEGTIGAIGDDEEIGNGLTEILRQFKPDIVFTTFLLDNHADHQNINRHLARSLRTTGLQPEIWSFQLYSTVMPNVVIDITELMDEKERLMRMWKSVRGNRDWAHYVRGMNAMTCRFIPGREQKYGEPYFVVPTKEYLDLCGRYFQL